VELRFQSHSIWQSAHCLRTAEHSPADAKWNISSLDCGCIAVRIGLPLPCDWLGLGTSEVKGQTNLKSVVAQLPFGPLRKTPDHNLICTT